MLDHQMVGTPQHLFGLLGEMFRQGEGEIVGLTLFERALKGLGLLLFYRLLKLSLPILKHIQFLLQSGYLFFDPV